MSWHRVGEKRAERTESPLEEKVYQSMKKIGLEPKLQFPFHTFWLDMSFPDDKVAVELDGEKYHNNPMARARDARKDALLETDGWKIERFPGWLAWRYPDVVAGKVGLRYFKEKLSRTAVLTATSALARFQLERDREFGLQIIENSI